MAMYEGGAGTTAPYPVALPDEPVNMNLELLVDEALGNIKEIDDTITSLTEKRAKYLVQLSKVRDQLLEKCEAAAHCLHAHEDNRSNY